MELIPTVATEKATSDFVFTHFNTDNGGGIHNSFYIFIIGLLVSQYMLMGYDASAHMVADSLEKGTEHEDEYMISEKELLVNRYCFIFALLILFISVPKDMGTFNCGAFVAGIVKGVLDGAGFPAIVTAHFVSVDGQLRPRTTILIKFVEKGIGPYQGSSHLLFRCRREGQYPFQNTTPMENVTCTHSPAYWDHRRWDFQGCNPRTISTTQGRRVPLASGFCCIFPHIGQTPRSVLPVLGVDIYPTFCKWRIAEDLMQGVSFVRVVVYGGQCQGGLREDLWMYKPSPQVAVKAVTKAIDAWKLVLKGRFRLLNEWCGFVELALATSSFLIVAATYGCISILHRLGTQ
ncbi:hypothetical protein IFM89_024192 [Coptis chinensis]|uniref:Uncharacterized protein n=1 Tax=Coptis chinensis TaxID=261450 RepID=A0A835HDX9_9MAGN|nr:hypothetical protein IFM89_024192 [Coptis chinensis]